MVGQVVLHKNQCNLHELVFNYSWSFINTVIGMVNIARLKIALVTRCLNTELSGQRAVLISGGTHTSLHCSVSITGAYSNCVRRHLPNRSSWLEKSIARWNGTGNCQQKPILACPLTLYFNRTRVRWLRKSIGHRVRLSKNESDIWKFNRPLSGGRPKCESLLDTCKSRGDKS